MSDLAAVREKRLQECRGKAAGRSKTCTCRNVRKGGDFDLRYIQIQQLQRFANDGMFYIRHRGHLFQRRIFQVNARFERPHDRDVYILVDRGGNQESLILAVVRREVGAAAAQSDPQWATRDDHIRNPRKSLLPHEAPRSHHSIPDRAHGRCGCPRQTPSFPSSMNCPPSGIPRWWSQEGPFRVDFCSGPISLRRSYRPILRPATCRRGRIVPRRRCFSTPCSWHAETPLVLSRSSTA